MSHGCQHSTAFSKRFLIVFAESLEKPTVTPESLYIMMAMLRLKIFELKIGELTEM